MVWACTGTHALQRLRVLVWAAVAGAILSTGACLPIPDSVDESIVIDTDDYDVLLDRYTNSYRDYGCGMQLMTESDQSYIGFTDVISNARSTIDIETLNFDDESKSPENLGLAFARVLADKARTGVRVRVLLDGLTHAAIGNIEANRVMLDAGIDVREYQPERADLSTADLLFRMHKKILVADGERAIIGGSNYGYRYQGPSQWRDTNVLLTGPIVTTLQHEFNYDWDNRTAPALLLLQSPATAPSAGDVVLRAIDQKPSEDDFDINNAVLIGLRLAKRRVDVEAPYFNPTPWLLDEMSDAVARGVEIRVLLNSETSNDVPQTYYADAALFDTILQRGIRLFLWNRTTRTMHSKAMIVDDAMAMVGTYNFNARSILWDTENAIFSTHPTVIQMIDQMIQNDFAHETVLEIDREWVRNQPASDQLKWRLYSLFSPLF